MDLWDHRGWRMTSQNKGLQEPEVLTPHFLKYLYEDFTPKFFIQLIEPIERLYSDYIFLKYGQDVHQFHNDTRRALQMLQDCETRYSQRWCFYDMGLYHKLPARLHLSCYSVFLSDWFKVYPRHAFHVTRIDEFQNDMSKVMTSVFNFLDIRQPPPSVLEWILSQQRRHVTKSKHGTVLPQTRQMLKSQVSGSTEFG